MQQRFPVLRRKPRPIPRIVKVGKVYAVISAQGAVVKTDRSISRCQEFAGRLYK